MVGKRDDGESRREGKGGAQLTLTHTTPARGTANLWYLVGKEMNFSTLIKLVEYYSTHPTSSAVRWEEGGAENRNVVVVLNLLLFSRTRHVCSFRVPAPRPWLPQRRRTRRTWPSLRTTRRVHHGCWFSSLHCAAAGADGLSSPYTYMQVVPETMAQVRRLSSQKMQSQTSSSSLGPLVQGRAGAVGST